MNRDQIPTREEAEEAVRTLIKWAGDDPLRKELIDTPRRVTDSYKEFFQGYKKTLNQSICKTFDKPEFYDDLIILSNVRIESFCEHHMAPIIGFASVAYIPNKKIIGLSKIPRIIDIYAKRLQIQERLAYEISNSLSNILMPKAVGVVICASHHCLTTRGAHKPGTTMHTSHYAGLLKSDYSLRREFLDHIKNHK